MIRDFTFSDDIYLVQPPHRLDLHNDFDFCGLHYSVEKRTLSLNWRRSSGAWVHSSNPASIEVEFLSVSEFRFLPRDRERPFTEDDCVSTLGYWSNQEWADGIVPECPKDKPDPSWLTAISFQSGATIAVQAATAHARITL
jgi:hypothetical protein